MIAPHPAAIDVAGQPYLRDAKGALVPIATIKAADLLMDELVREILGTARDVSAQLARFKAAAFERVAELQALIAQDHGATLGGVKGNLTLTSFDGLMRVQVQRADLLEFGPELQAAKALVDECVTGWAQGSGAELRTLVTRAFSVDKTGQINRAELFMLLRVEIADERWKRAMTAIRDSMRVVGSKAYVRFYERAETDGAWRAVSLDLATV